MSKEKALWTTEETKLFIKLALQQVKKNERKGSTLSKEGWEALMQQFNALSSRNILDSVLVNVQENPEYRKFRHRSLPYAQELTQLFQPIATQGTYMWTPTTDDPQDVYRPQLDLIEGSGDSDDIRNINGGAFPKIGQVNLNNAYSSGTNSGSKRKRGESGQNKKGKRLAMVIVDSVSIGVHTRG
ncbi:uncharacterized protein LOC129290066 [Prosopis cineraria]|uniref:uncharacterized protein LOC129290066 n=1 Tax=Prosopis cineraria TaxID=364024 RepID=UPI002410917A|nr:uncharacterized protein LOC129290066 [Prosopis cineraria]